MRNPSLTAARWLVCGWLMLAAPAFALGATDVRMIVDVSASMGHTDPDNLRSSAVGLLLRLLPDDGRAGVWTYGKYVNMLVKHDASNDLWKETAAIRTSNLESVGQRSNLLEALERASWDRKSGDRQPAHLVLLTDGRLDISDDAGVNAAQQRHLLTELVPELVAAGYKVHTLALSGQADFDLLKQLAAATGGYHGRMESPHALPQGLLALLGRVAAASTVEVGEAGSFHVAPGTRELTVLRLGTVDDEPVMLVAPDGERLARTTPRERIRWHVDAGYELATVDAPAAGLWRFEGSRRNVRVYAYGDLSITYVDFPGTVFPGEVRSFELEVTSHATAVDDRAFLDLLGVEAWLQGADGSAPVVVERGDHGHFRVNLQDLRGRGDYVLETRLWGPTFSQRLSLPFLLDNPLGVEIRPASDGFVLWAQVGAAELDHDSLRMAALVKRPPAPAKLFPLQRLPAGLWKLPVSGAKGLVEIALDMKGNYLNDRDFELRTEPIRVVLPVAEVKYVNLDLQGRPLLTNVPPEDPSGVTAPPSEGPVLPPRGTAPAVSQAGAPVPDATLPVWFVAVATVGNLAVVALLWWLLRLRRAPVEPTEAAERVRALAGLDHPGAGATSA